MSSTRKTLSSLKFIIYSICGIFLVAACFFFFGVQKTFSADLAISIDFLSDENINLIIALISSLGFGALIFCAFEIILKRFNISSYAKRYWIYFTVCIVYTSYMALSIPFSPDHDALEMYLFLDRSISNQPISLYQATYLINFATNKFVYYFYLAFCRLFSSTFAGVQCANLLCMYASIFFISKSCGNFFGKRFAIAALFALMVFFPYMLFVGPYIYLPSIFLLSLIIYLSVSKKLWVRIVSFALCGLLLVVRPTSLACVLVLMAFEFVYRLTVAIQRTAKTSKTDRSKVLTGNKNIIHIVCEIFALVVCIFGVKASVGLIMYQTNLHPYPNINNNATLSTLAFGTRFSGAGGTDTGVCVYSPLAPLKDDEISLAINRVWKLYELQDPNDYSAILAEQKNIKNLIAERTKSTVLSDTHNLLSFLSMKAYNLLSDKYQAYYYSPKLQNKDFTNEIYQNYNDKFFLDLNVLLSAFCICALIICIVAFMRTKKKPSKKDFRLAALILAPICIAVLMILLTEVMKKYTLDFYVPMVMVIAYVFGMIEKTVRRFQVKHLTCQRIGTLAVIFVFATLCFVGKSYAFNHYNIKVFKDSRFTLSQDSTKLDITLNKGMGYQIVQTDQTCINLDNLSSVTVDVNPESKKIFDIITPQGKTYMVNR